MGFSFTRVLWFQTFNLHLGSNFLCQLFCFLLVFTVPLNFDESKYILPPNAQSPTPPLFFYSHVFLLIPGKNHEDLDTVS